MHAYKGATRPRGKGALSATISFRDQVEKRRALEKIQEAQGHGDLSDTMREATAEYIARRLHLLDPGES